MFRRIAGTVCLVLAASIASSCGTEAPTPPSTVLQTLPETIMIMEAHAVPEELTIAVGQRVAFMNHDTTSYAIAGGRDPSTPDCPEINVVGVLIPGNTRSTEPFTTAKTCAFHVPRGQSALLTGRIIIR
jgi:hypothetical protein